MAYVPPSRRIKAQTSCTAPTAAPSPTSFYSQSQISEYIGSNNTLNRDPVSPDDLFAILLFLDQHPDWPSARQIFCKSNLDLLRGPTVAEGKYVPVFTEFPFKRGSFEFIGYFKVADIQWLQPNSPELIRMLEKKFSPAPSPTRRRLSGSGETKRRTEAAWKATLEREWALVTLQKHPTRNKNPF